MERFTLDRLPRRVLKGLDVETAFMMSRVIITAERLQLFRLLHGKALPPAGVAKRLELSFQAAEQLLIALSSLGLLRKHDSAYSNTVLAEKYFIKERSINWTRQYSKESEELFQTFSSLESILKLKRTGPLSPVKKKPDYVKMMEKDPVRARDFTLMLYHYHQKEAFRLAEVVDLRSYHALLDVGGGSGVMSIALVKKNPHLRACVLDIQPVCGVARKIIKSEGLSRKISVFPGDMYKDFPQGYDVIMFCDLGPINDCLINMAHESLPAGGLLLIVDRFVFEDGTRPLETALYRLIVPTSGMETRKDITGALKTAGFGQIRHRVVHKEVGVISAQKHRR
jgi:3-hydroxy-5-methyl-1-naphthoate 3-O-methyltransferase